MAIEISPLGLYQTTQIKALEQLASKHNVSEDLLMERAGKAAFHILREFWPKAQRIRVVCGSGNNGGDGYVLARLAHLAGLAVRVSYLGEKHVLTAVASHAKIACEKAHIPIELFDPEQLSTADVIVDAIFGTGLSRDVTGEWYAAIAAINQQITPVLALDVPSGLNSDTGKVHGIAVSADITVTFIGVKQGLVTGSGPNYCGKIFCDNLDLPKSLYDEVLPTAQSLFLPHLKEYLPQRQRTAHKGQFGHVVVLGGNYGMPGSVSLASLAALRVGAGLVTVATRPEHVSIVVGAHLEIMCLGINHPSEVESLLKKASVIVIGPGLGMDAWAQELLNLALSKDCPLVIDADGLNLLANKNETRDNWVLTPHPGEAARLLNQTIQSVENDRFATINALCEQYKGVCVLKGAGSLVLGSKDGVHVCRAGNPGMASGGMGDVLSGVIGGLIAQGMPLEQATQLGVCLHANAGDLAAKKGERGMLAMDLFPYLRQLIN